MIITDANGNSYTFSQDGDSNTTLDNGQPDAIVVGEFGNAKYIYAVDAQGNRIGNASIDGSTRKKTTSSWNWLDSRDDSEEASTDVITTTMDNTDTTVDEEYTQTVNRTQGVDNDLYDFDSSYSTPTSFGAANDDANRTTGQPNPTQSLGGGMGQVNAGMDAAFGYNTPDQGQSNIGNGSAAGPESSSGSGDVYYDTGSLEGGGYWESYDDGSWWWYAEYDSGGNQIYYEDGSYQNSGLTGALAAAGAVGGGAPSAPDPDEFAGAQFSVPPGKRGKALETKDCL